MKTPEDTKDVLAAVGCGDMVCDGPESGACQRCEGTGHFYMEWVGGCVSEKCKFCGGTGRSREIASRSHT